MNSAVTISAVLVLSIAIQNPVHADVCGADDDISCLNGGVCTNGRKSYLEMGINNFSFLSEQKRGMHCKCPNETIRKSHEHKSGMTGVHCDVKYELCSDNKVCFHGGTCVAEQWQSDQFHCQCPQDPKFDVWAGISCAVPAEDFCDEDDPFYDITGGKWFCTRGGKCVNGEKNLAKKCDCPEGTFGLHCEFMDEQECSLQCENGGLCKVGIKDFSKMAEYGLDIAEYLGGQEEYGEHCVCPHGFSGVKCQTENVVRCGDGICFNGSECVQTVSLEGKEVINEYCRCKSGGEDGGFAGKFCEQVPSTKCPAPYGHPPDEYFCTNGGECPDSPHLPCQCKDGFTGPKCEIPPDANKDEEYKCDLECQNGGECFFGQSTVVDEELKNLHESGLDFLVDDKHCRCSNGYVGLRCEKKYNTCGDNEHFCLNESECIPNSDGFTCDCKEAATFLTSYAGDYCEHASTEFCSGPGANKESFCTNHGTCLGTIGIGDDHVGCQCKDGWTGDYCEYQSSSSATKVASTAFSGFIATLIGIVILFAGILFIARKKKGDRDIEYEKTNREEPIHNPYGEVDSDLSDGSDHDYEFKDVAII